MKQFVLVAGVLVYGMVVGEATASGQDIKPSILNSTGGTGTISGNFYDYSVGEMTMVSTLSGAGITVTQGLLQTGLFPNLSVPTVTGSVAPVVFPNPANNQLNLKFGPAAHGRVICKLLDIAGHQMMLTQDMVRPGAELLQLDITGFAAAMYVLEVQYAEKTGTIHLFTYKIEKH